MRIVQKSLTPDGQPREVSLEQALSDSLDTDLNKYGLQRAVAALMLASAQGRPISARELQSALRDIYRVEG